MSMLSERLAVTASRHASIDSDALLTSHRDAVARLYGDGRAPSQRAARSEQRERVLCAALRLTLFLLVSLCALLAAHVLLSAVTHSLSSVK